MGVIWWGRKGEREGGRENEGKRWREIKRERERGRSINLIVRS